MTEDAPCGLYNLQIINQARYVWDNHLLDRGSVPIKTLPTEGEILVTPPSPVLHSYQITCGFGLGPSQKQEKHRQIKHKQLVVK